MSKEIRVPDIGSDEVEITEIMVAVGDHVALEQSLLAVEGDKAAMEVPAPSAGIVNAILVKVGDKVTTGSAIMHFTVEEQSSSDVSALETPSQPQIAASDVAADPTITRHLVHLPDIGGDEVDVTEIMVAVGDVITVDQPILAVEGDKAAMEVPAPLAGRVVEINVAVGAKVATGTLIMAVEVAEHVSSAAAPESRVAPQAQVPSAVTTAAVATPALTPAPAMAATAATITENQAYIHASPAVRRLAREFGVNLLKVSGTGRKGRIVKEDVQAYVKELIKRSELAPAVGQGGGFTTLPWPKVDFAKFGEIEEVELSRIQKISGPNLHRNWAMIPHVTQFDEADTTELEAFRKEQNVVMTKDKVEVKITPLVFILKAVAKALEAHPRFCSSLSEDGAKLIMKHYIHIGVAVDTPNGLVVPVVRDVNKKGIVELSRELAEISSKARAGKLTSSEMQGGCFTVSSLGGIGGTHFTPIVNAPEVAILGVSKSEFKPKWDGQGFVPRLMLPLALSYDHRVIDGAAGARFITTLTGILSDIRRLIM